MSSSSTTNIAKLYVYLLRIININAQIAYLLCRFHLFYPGRTLIFKRNTATLVYTAFIFSEPNPYAMNGCTYDEIVEALKFSKPLKQSRKDYVRHMIDDNESLQNWLEAYIAGQQTGH